MARRVPDVRDAISPTEGLTESDDAPMSNSERGADADIDLEAAKRAAHVASEKKCRDQIRAGFDELRSTLPDDAATVSRAVMLRKAAEYMDALERRYDELVTELQQYEEYPVKQKPKRPPSRRPKRLQYDDIIKRVCRELRIDSSEASRITLQYHDSDLDMPVDVQSQEDLDEMYDHFAGSHRPFIPLDLRFGGLRIVRGSLFDVLEVSPSTPVTDEQHKNAAMATSSMDLASSASNVGRELSQGPADAVPEEYQLPSMYLPGSDHAQSNVKEEDVDHLWRELSVFPQMQMGGPGFDQVERQKGRVRRFLDACRGVVPNASRLLCAHFSWLESFQPDKISIEEIRKEMECHKLYFHGRDREGHPVLVWRIRLHDKTKRDKMASIKHFIYMMQDFVCRRDLSGSGKFVLIYDRRGCTRVNSDLALFKRLLRLYQLNYPATLHRCYVLNPDAIFYYAFLAVSTVMSSHTRARFILLSSDWEEVLLNDIASNQLQRDYGGTSDYEYRFNPQLPGPQTGW